MRINLEQVFYNIENFLMNHKHLYVAAWLMTVGAHINHFKRLN